MALLRSCSVQREAELLLKSSSSIFLPSCLFFSSSTMFALWRNSGDTISLLSPQPTPHIHPPLIWWWLGWAWACAWMWMAMGCETDSQSRLECLSPAWSSLQGGTKGALQGSSGWISSKEPIAGSAGWVAGRGPAVAPAVGHSTGRGHKSPSSSVLPIEQPQPSNQHIGFWSSAQKSRVRYLEDDGGMKCSDKGQLKVGGNVTEIQMTFVLKILPWRCGHYYIAWLKSVEWMKENTPGKHTN